MTDSSYDIAVSFAGEHRDYVEATVRACQARGLEVFYDKDKSNDWWGGNFLREQRTVYSSRTRYFVPFLSQEYLRKPIPMDEFSSAMMTAVKQGDGYILPILMDNVQIPADLMHPHIHYLRASDYTPEQLAEQLVAKVGLAKAAGQQPAPVGDVVEHALAVRLPKIVPTSWSKYEQLDALFEHISTRFQQGAEQLRPQGLVCTVRRREDHLMVRVERGGDTIAGIDVRKGKQMGDDYITWSTNYRMGSENSFNGWAKPVFDKQAGVNAVEVNDMGRLGRGDGGNRSYEDFFTTLWDMLIEQVEQRSR